MNSKTDKKSFIWWLMQTLILSSQIHVTCMISVCSVQCLHNNMLFKPTNLKKAFYCLISKWWYPIQYISKISNELRFSKVVCFFPGKSISPSGQIFRYIHGILYLYANKIMYCLCQIDVSLLYSTGYRNKWTIAIVILLLLKIAMIQPGNALKIVYLNSTCIKFQLVFSKDFLYIHVFFLI